MRSATAVASGAISAVKISSAPSSEKCPDAEMPLSTAPTAPLPKISAGMVSGRISRISSTPALRRPSVNAAPTPPSRLRIGVPSSSAATSVASAARRHVEQQADHRRGQHQRLRR